ncbi:MAG: TetR/AcrR family transcriptional regulator [Pseudomonadota bacterium]
MRLERRDWLEFALNALAIKGYGALKAQSLAKGIGVTRGSFYWHFESLEAFNAALIDYWSEHTTERLITGVSGAGAPLEQLERLIGQAMRSGADLERAVRSWATVDEGVANHVARVDARRIQFAADLLAALDVPKDEIGARSKMLYWAAIGRLMIPFPHENTLSDEDVTALVALFAKRDA